mgnify:CR=1 FL=1
MPGAIAGIATLVTVANGGTGTATPQWSVQTFSFAAAPVDTVRARAIYPFDSGQVRAIYVAALGTAPTAGTLAVQRGIGAGGATMLPSATVALNLLAANTVAGADNSASPGLTATTANLQGDVGDGITIEVVNVNQDIVVMIAIGPQ